MSDAFDLSRFAPPPDVTFRLRQHPDRVFVVDADPDVDVVARMLRVENVIRGVDEGNVEEAFVEAKQLLHSMILARDPEPFELKVGGQEITVLLALILRGATVAQAVMDAITSSNALEAEKPPSSAFERDAELEPEAGEGRGAPLGSEKHSSAASSSLADDDAGRLAIGTG